MNRITHLLRQLLLLMISNTTVVLGNLISTLLTTHGSRTVSQVTTQLHLQNTTWPLAWKILFSGSQSATMVTIIWTVMCTNTSQTIFTQADPIWLNHTPYAFLSIMLATCISLSTLNRNTVPTTPQATKVQIYLLCPPTTAWTSSTPFGTISSTRSTSTLRDLLMIPTGQHLQLTQSLCRRLVQWQFKIQNLTKTWILKDGLRKATILRLLNTTVSKINLNKANLDIVPDVALPQWYIDENVAIC